MKLFRNNNKENSFNINRKKNFLYKITLLYLYIIEIFIRLYPIYIIFLLYLRKYLYIVRKFSKSNNKKIIEFSWELNIREDYLVNTSIRIESDLLTNSYFYRINDYYSF
jgi:hypothetical protein